VARAQTIGRFGRCALLAFLVVVALSCGELVAWRLVGRPNDEGAIFVATLLVGTAAGVVAALLASVVRPSIAVAIAVALPCFGTVRHALESTHVAWLRSSWVDGVATLLALVVATRLLERRLVRVLLAVAATALAAVVAVRILPRRAVATVDRTRRPDVVMIVMDTTRPDHLSLYGYGRPTTPNLERFAKQAAVYADAWSVAPWTPSSHASMLTGLLPAEHGVDGDPQPRFESDAARLPQVLRDAGYATAGFPANPNLFAAGWERGFDVYRAPWLRGSHTWIVPLNRLLGATGVQWTLEERNTRRILDLARSWWDEQRDRPRFLFLNFIDPHLPHVPPPEFLAKFLPDVPGDAIDGLDQNAAHYFVHPGVDAPKRRLFEALYDAEIASLDAQLGAFFDWLAARGDLDPAVVVVTADHGERLGERGLIGHDYLPDPVVLRVPLVVRAPGRVAPGRVAARVQLDGLPGSLLALAGVAAPPAMAAHTLEEPNAPFVRAQLQESHSFIQWLAIDEPHFDPVALRGDSFFVTDGKFAWLWSPQQPDSAGQLVDLEHDPDCRRDVTSEHPEVAAALARYGRSLPRFTPRGAPPPIDAADVVRLRELGYVH
jgi:arylsulfatase A-like enzyme